MKDKGYAGSSGAGTISNVNSGPSRGGKGGTKSTSAPSSGLASRSVIGCRPKEMSPSSTSMSKNTHKGSKY